MSLATEQQLIAAALSARQHAHAPYSNFLVGAALLDGAGKIHLGTNVENASYGLTICAERVAIARAVADGVRNFKAIAVATSGAVSPCGACRQVLAEFCDDLPVILVDADQANSVSHTSLAELLPLRFGLDG